MPIKLLSTPTQLRSALKRLIRGSERIDVFLDAIDDADFVKQLAAAAGAGTEVNVTTNLDASTPPECVQRLVDAGAHVGVFEPSVHRRRAVARFKPGVIIFDNEAEWWTAGMVGSFSGTTRSLAESLEAVTLVEANEFADGNEAGNFLLEILNWGDSVNHLPVDPSILARHRKAFEAAHPSRGAAAAASRRSSRVVEVKPDSVGYASPLSWQELRRCDWGTYWSALLEADRIRGPRFKDSLCGDRGWLFGLDAAHRAYSSGPDAWTREDVRDDLLGRSRVTKLLGRASASFAKLLDEDESFRREVGAVVERCIVDPSPPTLRDALGPIVARDGVAVQDVSGVLAAAAPDRFFSIASKATQLRLSNVVGFDLSARSSAVQDLLTRYVDAIEVIRAFPWADATSAERTSEHVREPDAWDKRVALLGCLIC